MLEIPWYDAVDYIKPYVVRIYMPKGAGTGFLLSKSSDGEIFGIATAAHVVDYSYWWELPIRILHPDSKKVQLLREDDRAILIDEDRDVAVIVFRKDEIPYPEDNLSITPKDSYFRVGNELGWVGFPALTQNGLCFFSGRVSSYRSMLDSYLVDGVAINGVSGGPAFSTDEDAKVSVVGVVSAYIPNRATGEALPGLLVVSGVRQFHDVIQSIESLDDAKVIEEEEKPSRPEISNSEHGTTN